MIHLSAEVTFDRARQTAHEILDRWFDQGKRPTEADINHFLRLVGFSFDILEFSAMFSNIRPESAPVRSVPVALRADTAAVPPVGRHAVGFLKPPTPVATTALSVNKPTESQYGAQERETASAAPAPVLLSPIVAQMPHDTDAAHADPTAADETACAEAVLVDDVRPKGNESFDKHHFYGVFEQRAYGGYMYKPDQSYFFVHPSLAGAKSFNHGDVVECIRKRLTPYDLGRIGQITSSNEASLYEFKPKQQYPGRTNPDVKTTSGPLQADPQSPDLIVRAPDGLLKIDQTLAYRMGYREGSLAVVRYMRTELQERGVTKGVLLPPDRIDPDQTSRAAGPSRPLPTGPREPARVPSRTATHTNAMTLAPNVNGESPEVLLVGGSKPIQDAFDGLIASIGGIRVAIPKPATATDVLKLSASTDIVIVMPEYTDPDWATAARAGARDRPFNGLYYPADSRTVTGLDLELKQGLVPRWNEMRRKDRPA